MIREYLDDKSTASKVGKELAEPVIGHFCMENAVKGVTDVVGKGQRFVMGFEEGVVKAS